VPFGLPPAAAGEDVAAVVDLQEIRGRFAVGAAGGDVGGERRADPARVPAVRVSDRDEGAVRPGGMGDLLWGEGMTRRGRRAWHAFRVEPLQDSFVPEVVVVVVGDRAFGVH